MRIISKKTLDEFRGRLCEWCQKVYGSEPHHLFCKGMDSGGRLDIRPNLMALCRDCHQRFHDGHIRRNDLLAIVAKRENCLQDDIVAVKDMFRRLRKDSGDEAVEAAIEGLSFSAMGLAVRVWEETNEPV